MVAEWSLCISTMYYSFRASKSHCLKFYPEYKIYRSVIQSQMIYIFLTNSKISILFVENMSFGLNYLIYELSGHKLPILMLVKL